MRPNVCFGTLKFSPKLAATARPAPKSPPSDDHSLLSLASVAARRCSRSKLIECAGSYRGGSKMDERRQHTDLLLGRCLDLEDPEEAGVGFLNRRGRRRRVPRALSIAGRSRIRSSRLVENFSEFLASRNVINVGRGSSSSSSASSVASSSLSAFDTYDKIVSDSRGQQQNPNKPLLRAAQEFCPHNHLHRQCKPNSGPKRVLLLLRALISRKQRNRSLLVVSLLRAPVVLAALFSLALVASLLVLYTMNFHAHNRRLEHDQLSLERSPEVGHRIGSRQLEQAAAAILADQQQQQQQQTQQRQQQLRAERALERALTVQTECGKAVGKPDGHAFLFEGIPYASPPVGALRWRRPHPVWFDEGLCQPNATITVADERFKRNHCAQLSPIGRQFTGSEDCLYLDVYSPQLDQMKKLPVMVYIHGGFLAYGSSGRSSSDVNWMRARPSGQLASELNVVLVAFNYRLQALGFMSLMPLGAEGANEGNYGLWDQLAALKWVKRNIEGFGGDPDNIVLFGPDSASSLPMALLTRRPHQTSADSAADPIDHYKDLFRAVWLTNPTLYYELPYELASQHYQRLFLNQSPCSRPTISVALAPSPAQGHAEVSPAQGTPVEVPKHTDGENQLAKQTLECLMKLSPEQVVRHYLGQDDPSYRLDDQNSLPIHGIFADQFVTVDRELVQDSYPFGRLGSPISARQQTSAPHYRTLVPADGPQPAASNESTGQDNYDNCLGGHQKLVCGGYARKDLLVGSSAQAVEYWPCPRNLNQWQWPDFKRYVATSLNSFIMDTYKRVAQVYKVPLDNGEASKVGPKETYLSMVSDIRQTCPVNELADSMRSRGHRVRRYIVETPYSGGGVRTEQNGTAAAAATLLPEFAFHTWDLMAFFGFQFDTNFRPSNRDLQFQRHIRQMVAEFVHNTNTSAINNTQDTGHLLFSKEAEARQVPRAQYKADECRMWRSHLGQSYAWVS